MNETARREQPEENALPIRAVAFDYGMVLSEPPHAPSREALHRLTGLSHEQLESHYWRDRHAYDRGDLTGLEYWQRLAVRAGLELTGDEIAELNALDARMWTTVNPAMLAWHTQLRQAGIRTAILSNMGDAVLASILKTFAWMEDFDVLIWSYQHRMAKPEPAIYQLLLDRLATPPEETLFLDDKPENIEAAARLGIQGLQFSTVERLRQDLVRSGLEASLPLP